MSVGTTPPTTAGTEPGRVATAAVAVPVGSRRWEFMYFALRNKKLVLGLGIEVVFVLAAIFGPLVAPYSAAKFVAQPNLHPSLKHLLGTTYFGEDVFSQVLFALRDSYLVGFLGAACAALIGLVIGFTAGWRGGVVDEVLQMFTNIVVMMPALVLLIVIGAYLKQHSAFFEGCFIGVTTWPWVARAVRAQTFTLRSRDFVDLSRMSGKRGPSIVIKDIAPNMASYLFLVFVLLFGSSMLIAVSYDFLGLGPTNSISLGDMMFNSQQWSALVLHVWWWFIPPGAVMTLMVAALLIANVGLDEVFNPKLREM
ncbi:MAG TPA: ABC transporter permease [Acidimicrobiales bacterium]|nr:ABC transporter permease [Acidimicrobiales bacterium]